MQEVTRRGTWIVVTVALISGACRTSRPVRATATARTISSGAIVWRLPVRYIADRFAVAPVTVAGDTLVLFTDTGGGANMLWDEAVRRLQLAPERVAQGRDTATLVRLPALATAAAIPLPQLPPFGDRFFVPRQTSHAFARDGLLGRTWFADRRWLFDYPGRSLAVLPAGLPLPGAPVNQVSLGFQADSAGRRTTHFPRIRIEVDGDSLDLLFDTGATVSLTDSALARLADGGPAERGTSFISQQVFDRWRQRHPDWQVIERADRTLEMPMILVPRVSIGGHVVGPVWFTMRPDRNFHQFMSQWMDRRIDGALGGSALKYFRVTVDYPRAIAVFERP